MRQVIASQMVSPTDFRKLKRLEALVNPVNNHKDYRNALKDSKHAIPAISTLARTVLCLLSSANMSNSFNI